MSPSTCLIKIKALIVSMLTVAASHAASSDSILDLCKYLAGLIFNPYRQRIGLVQISASCVLSVCPLGFQTARALLADSLVILLSLLSKSVCKGV